MADGERRLTAADVCWSCTDDGGTGLCAACKADRDAQVPRVEATIAAVADAARTLLMQSWERGGDVLTLRRELRTGVKAMCRELGVTL